jgi:hypothetical protein
MSEGGSDGGGGLAGFARPAGGGLMRGPPADGGTPPA